VAEVELNEAQETAIRRMMEAVVGRDEATVAEMLAHRAHPENVYAAPASDFWMWADNYGDEPLRLAMPLGNVDGWGVWGFPTPGGVEGELSLHADVWADFGRTDLTIQFRVIPGGHGYAVELDDMHVM
jgi:hypothetical protein